MGRAGWPAPLSRMPCRLGFARGPIIVGPVALEEGGSLVVLPTVAGLLFALYLALAASFVRECFRRKGAGVLRGRSPKPRAGDLGSASSQPSDAPESPIQRRACDQDHAHNGDVTIFPLQFRHVLEVHAVDAGDRGRDRDDGKP